jgi:predicted PurR-regulated permease PerM
MGYFENLIKSDIFKKILAVLLLFGLFYFFRDMINLFLLTFIFTYGFYSAHDYIYRKLNKIIKVSRNIVVMGVYLLLILLIVLICIKYIPIITGQLIEVVKDVSNADISKLQNKIPAKLLEIIQEINIKTYISTAGDNVIGTVTNIGKIGLNVFLAFVLSLFFVLEKKELREFGFKLENSRISYIYKFYKFFVRSFIESFGKILQMQFLVAFINGVLSTIILGIMGFPQVLGLGFMVFIFGLIPVAGVIITLVPLTIIAFQIGGAIKVLYVLIMIAGLHSLESYVLNPKLMSAKTKLPIFITFAILIVSEHLMGIWGLLIGLPMFMFLLKVIGIDDSNNKITNFKSNLKG